MYMDHVLETTPNNRRIIWKWQYLDLFQKKLKLHFQKKLEELGMYIIKKNSFVLSE